MYTLAKSIRYVFGILIKLGFKLVCCNKYTITLDEDMPCTPEI